MRYIRKFRVLWPLSGRIIMLEPEYPDSHAQPSADTASLFSEAVLLRETERSMTCVYFILSTQEV